MRGRNIPDYLIEAQALLVDALRNYGGPVKTRTLASALYGNPARSDIAKVTQRLRSLEKDGIVIRGGSQARGFDWRLKQ